MKNTAKLNVNNETYELPLVEGSEGEIGIDVSNLRSQSGLITLDKGFKNTGSTKSAITFLNGEEGVLRYRGYSIEELSSKSSFLEVAYLLIYGELPSNKELDGFTNEVSSHTLVHEDVKSILDGFPSRAHPMGVLSSLVSSLTAFYPKSLDPNRSSEEINGTIIRFNEGVDLINNSERQKWSTGLAGSSDVTIAVMGISALIEGEEGDAISSEANGDRNSIKLPSNQINYLKTN